MVTHVLAVYEECINCGSDGALHDPGCDYFGESAGYPVCYACRNAPPTVWSSRDQRARCQSCSDHEIQTLLAADNAMPIVEASVHTSAT
jgi:hypothetical protein